VGHVLESITGHLSRRMLEHYSDIRIDAKRQALDASDVQRGSMLPAASHGNSGHPQNTDIEAVSTCPTASRHNHVPVWFCRARRLPVSY
jgi:hypothetical protein